MSEILNAKDYTRKLTNIYYLSIGIPLLFFIWVYLESSAEKLNPLLDPKYRIPVFVAVFIISLALIVLGRNKFNTRLSEARQKDQLIKKLVLYQKGTTIRAFAYSVSSLLISIGFFLTDFQPFAAFYGIVIVLFSINNLNQRKIVADLLLKDDDKKIILDGLDLPK
jgi:hypothetical protein